MLKLFIPAGLVAFLVPAAFALFVNSESNNPDQKEIIVAQANVETVADSSGSDKVAQPDAMPELGQTPAPTSIPELPKPELTPVPTLEPVATPVVAAEVEDKLVEPVPTSTLTDEKTRKAISDDIIEEEPAVKSSEPVTKTSSEKKPESGSNKKKSQAPDNRVANEPNGATVVVTGRIVSVEPDEGNSLRAEVKLRSGESIIVLFPPWSGMRVPSIGGMVTAETRKLSTSDGRATLRALSIRSTGAPEGQPPARMVPGIRRAVVPAPVIPGPPPTYF
ncbi:hypothetical protein CVU37_01980 [candidate division BRC1 bacterium HGW-BRC1-1]|jgi:hypothetical protein|nr:MAG: hypothetical protein CVU37_01980 [candidate division BRC1 bacterium HGW-BRC1-1]